MMDTTSGSTSQEGRLIDVDAGVVVVQGYLHLPENALGIVLLADASDSNRYEYIAQSLRTTGPSADRLATLVVNLLTPEDQALDRETAFFRDNVSVLHQRIVWIANSLIENPETRGLRIFYFGAGSTGAAALIAAAVRPDIIVAVVAADARLDLAQRYLSEISAPTLLLAAENDTSAVETNRKSLDSISANNKKLETIPGATTLFGNSDTEQEIARLAGEWYGHFLGLG